jgi:SAM-dependent methyltransferase
MPESLRGIFDGDAELYDRARPGYPAELITDLASLAAIGPGSRVLEIAPGTGQATRALVELGAHVTAIELGPQLAAVLRRRVAGLPVDVRVGAFEDEPLPEAAFDAVACFTAWHWLEPEIRAKKVAAVLVPGGRLATIATEHVRGGSVAFFAQAQDCYQRWDPATPPDEQLQPASQIPTGTDEVDRSPSFESAVRRRYERDIAYTSAEYLDVLRTYSGHRALSQERRAGLLGCIGGLIDGPYGGSISKRYLYELRVARRAERSRPLDLAG